MQGRYVLCSQGVTGHTQEQGGIHPTGKGHCHFPVSLQQSLKSSQFIFQILVHHY